MGVVYRDELKKAAKKAKRSGYPSRDSRSGKAAAARSEAIKREQSRKAVHLRAKEKAIQVRLLDG